MNRKFTCSEQSKYYFKDLDAHMQFAKNQEQGGQ